MEFAGGDYYTTMERQTCDYGETPIKDTYFNNVNTNNSITLAEMEKVEIKVEPDLESIKEEPNIEFVSSESTNDYIKLEFGVDSIKSEPVVDPIKTEPTIENIETEYSFESVEDEGNIYGQGPSFEEFENNKN